MFKRKPETSRRSEGNENASDEISVVKGNKQFGSSAANKSFNRSNNNNTSTTTNNKESSALKLKSDNQKNEQFNKKTNEKQKMQVFNEKTTKSNIPLKRGESAIGQIQHSQSKKQDIRVDCTYRQKEQEQEWVPEGLHLDFNAFDDTLQESSYHVKDVLSADDVDVEAFPIIERQFTVQASIDIQQDIEQAEIEHDTSTVEYCPPKEQEIPYEPHPSCIIDVSNFTSYADMDAYEYARLTTKDQDDFSLYEDLDVLKQNMSHPINDEALEFDYDSDSVHQDSDLSNDLDFSSIPFSDHTFDVDHFIQCNN